MSETDASQPDKTSPDLTPQHASADSEDKAVAKQTEADRGDEPAAVPEYRRPGHRPGDPGYAPPARVAQVAGQVLGPQHYDYHPGHSAMSVHGNVPLAMPPPADPTVSSATAAMRPSQLSAAAATTVLQKIVGDTGAYIKDFPHMVAGELAVYVQFYREMAARRAALNTAHALGRTLEPDEVDQATFTPPPEFFQLRHMAASLTHGFALYDRALSDASVALSNADQATIDRIKAEFAPLADGPTKPPANDAGEPQETTEATTKPAA